MKRKQKIKRAFIKQLFDYAGPESALKVTEDLIVFNNILDKSREIKSIFFNPQFTSAERQKTAELIGSALGIHDITLKSILHLTENRLIDEMPVLIDKLKEMYLTARDKAKVIIQTPVEITRRLEEKLKESLKSALNKEVELQSEIDSSLIGGLRVMVGTRLIDYSIKGQLRLLKEALLKE